MDIKDSIKKAIAIIKLDEKVIGKVSKDKDTWKVGLIIIAIGSILSAIASHFMSDKASSAFDILGAPEMAEVAKTTSITSIITAPIGSIIGTLIIVGIIFLIAKLFGGKSTYKELFQPVSFASILSWLGILNLIIGVGNFINFLAGIWSLVVLIVIVRKINSFTTGKAIFIVLIPLIILAVIAIIILIISLTLLGTGALGLSTLPNGMF